MTRNLATKFDTARASRRVAGSVSSLGERLDLAIDPLEALINGLAPTTAVATLSFNNYLLSSEDFSGLGIESYSWPTPYTQNVWLKAFEKVGQGSINYVSLALPRGDRTFPSNSVDVRLTIDDKVIAALTTSFSDTTSATSREYVFLGSCAGSRRAIQNSLPFAANCKVEVRYNQVAAPPSVSIITNYQMTKEL
jgi:hypothetical protein